MRSSARRHWRALVAGLGATVVIVATELARPFPLKLVVDRLLREHGGRAFDVQRGDWTLLAGVALLAISIALLDAVASTFVAQRLRRTGDLVVHDLRAAIYSHLQRLTLAFRERRQTTDLAARVAGDVDAVGAVFRESLRPLATSVLLLAGMLVVSIALGPAASGLMRVPPDLALAVAAIALVVFVVSLIRVGLAVGRA